MKRTSSTASSHRHNALNGLTRIFNITSRRRILTLVGLALVSALSSGCSVLQRSSASGYGSSRYDFDVSDLREERDASLREDATLELGFEPGSRESKSGERYAIEQRVQLKKLERRIVSNRERNQYYRHKPLMKNDVERLEFLSIPSFEGRSRWLEMRGLSAANVTHPPAIQKVIEENDLVLGMTQQAVRDSWGEPETVEVAGNPVYGNERWTYTEYITSPDGYQGERRLIYFESGRVVGWERN